MSSNEAAWWSKTRRLMAVCLAVWFIAGFVIPLFVNQLNAFVFYGFLLGYYMAAQGSLIIFVLVVFWFAGRQDAIDREHGVAEED
ncbi:MAG: DUF4212 domain-containing protein [Pseudomonadota bacterium]